MHDAETCGDATLHPAPTIKQHLGQQVLDGGADEAGGRLVLVLLVRREGRRDFVEDCTRQQRRR
jgi:hypothetical protein